jgi:hypothetical protein
LQSDFEPARKGAASIGNEEATMNVHRDRITAPGMRDNDWAHTPDDDTRFAAGARRVGARTGAASSRVDDVSGDRGAIVVSDAKPGRRVVSGATPYWE